MNDIDKCLFCLESIKKEQVVNPKYCSCKIKLHDNCLSEMENSGLLCPICRKKANNTIEFQIIRLYMIYVNVPFIIWFPFFTFNRYPNFFSFILLICWCILVVIILTILLVIYYGLFNNQCRKYVITGLFFIFGIIYYNHI